MTAEASEMEELDQETENELEELKNELERTLGKEKLQKKMAMAHSERTAVRSDRLAIFINFPITLFSPSHLQ